MNKYKITVLLFLLLSLVYSNTLLASFLTDDYEHKKIVNIDTLHFSDAALNTEFEVKTSSAIEKIKKLSKDSEQHLVIITGNTSCGEDYEEYASRVEDELLNAKIKHKNILIKYYRSKNISFGCTQSREVNITLYLYEKKYEYKTSMVLLNGEKTQSAIILKTKEQSFRLDKPLELVEIGSKNQISEPKKISLIELRNLTGKILDTANKKKYHFTLYFEFTGIELEDESKERLELLLNKLASIDKPYINISGYTDTIGIFEENYKLGLKRANIVADIIRASGIDYLQMDIQSYSELNLAVPTPDEVNEPLNRRVELLIQ